MNCGQGKYWCFTVNNYTDEDVDRIQDVDELDREWSYVVIGKEIGEGGTPHLQGYIEMNKVKRLSAMKKLMPKAHFEVRLGSSKQASEYCKKDGDYFEWGTVSEGRGKKGSKVTEEKYAAAYALLLDGKLEEIEPDIQIRHYSNLVRLKLDRQVMPEELKDTCGIWIHGPPGIGKSTKARSLCNNKYYDKACNKWWDSYNNEEYVIVDDLDKHHECLGHHIKRWTDKFGFPAEQKGRTIMIRPKYVIITSNYSPEEIFKDPVMAAAIVRRCSILKYTQQIWLNNNYNVNNNNKNNNI